MSEEAAKAAIERRRAPTPNADAAAAEMLTADDVFTTCQKCGKRVGVKHVGGAWIILEHECGSASS